MNRATAMLLLIAACVFAMAPPSVCAADTFYFCGGQEIGKSRFFYSDGFQGDQVHSLDYQNAFRDFVKSHYNASVIAVCDTKGYTQSEAKAKRDQDAALKRQIGNNVVFTNWTY